MALSDGQIERYSRQIIVPRVGGRAQERLFAARIALIGDSRDLAAPLAYLAAAGAGTLAPIVTDGASAARTLVEEALNLNPDSRVDVAGAAPGRATLALVIAGGSAALEVASAMLDSIAGAACVFARVDSPGRIGVFPHGSPCPRCVPELLATPAERGANAGIVAMAATAEAFKLAAGFDSDPRAAVAEFSGYACAVRTLTPNPRCRCANGSR
jgi:hypothetical protein